MTDAKQNKPDANGAPAKSAPNNTPEKEAIVFQGIPTTNVLPPVDGKYMLTFKIEGNITSNIGDKVTVIWNKIKHTGVLNRVEEGNVIALSAIIRN